MLKLTEVRARYGKIEALHGISLEVGNRELVTLIGANGAGKTTTIKAVCGLLRPTAGKIEFLGADITALPPYEIARLGVGICPEGRKVFPRLTVEENLEMGAFARHGRKSVQGDMAEVYTLFPVLFERRRQPAGSLSGGEQQMLALGRALMMKPKVVLFDEPSLGLAPIMVEAIGKIIGQLKESGLSILLVEQNANLALSLADRGYLMETGKIILEGTAAELRRDERVRKAYLGR